MLKKILLTTLFVFLLISLAIWSPWEEYDLSFARFFGVEEIEKYSGLQLYSLKGELELYIDDEYMGKVSPEEDFLPIADIKPGSHIVRINRISDPENSYYEITKSINFIENLNVIIAYELGPSEQFSQGHIFYARKNDYDDSIDSARLNITSRNIDSVEVFLNDKRIGVTPLENYLLDLSNIYVLTLKKDGYEDLVFNILPDDDEARMQLSGTDLFIETHLFWIPQEIVKESVN